MTYTLSEIGYFEIIGYGETLNYRNEIIDKTTDIVFWLKLKNGTYIATKRIWMW